MGDYQVNRVHFPGCKLHLVFRWHVDIHLMVNWLFGARWFGFLRSPKMKGIVSSRHPRIPNHRAPNHQLHPRKLTWNLKMMGFNRKLLFQGFIFRFHVSFRECTPLVRHVEDVGIGDFPLLESCTRAGAATHCMPRLVGRQGWAKQQVYGNSQGFLLIIMHRLGW